MKGIYKWSNYEPNFYLFFDFHSPKLEAIFGLSEIITTTKQKEEEDVISFVEIPPIRHLFHKNWVKLYYYGLFRYIERNSAWSPYFDGHLFRLREVMTMIEGVLLDLIGYPDSSSSALFFLFSFVLYYSRVLESNTKEIQPHLT